MHLPLERYCRPSILRGLALSIIAFLLCCPLSTRAQDASLRWFAEGAVAAGLYAPSSGVYSGVVTLNAYGDVGITIRLSDLFSVGGKAGYHWMPGTLQYDEATTLSIEDDPVPAVIRHEQNVQLGSVFLEPTVSMTFSTWHVDLGVRLGVLTSGEMQSSQEVIDPPGVQFDSVPVLIDSSAPYPGLAAIGAWASIGVYSKGSRLGDYRLEPGISVLLPITTLSTTSPFRVWSASLGLRIAYDPQPELPIRRDTVVSTDTTVVESSSETETREQIIIRSVDSSTVATTAEIITTIRVDRELIRTVGIGTPLILTEAKAVFVTADDEERERVTLRVATDRHELQVHDTHWPKATFKAMPQETVDTAITDVVEASFAGVQRLPNRPVIRWSVERWDTCRIRFLLAAGGDTEPLAWRLVITDQASHIIDSLGGTGSPPSTLDRVIGESVLRTMRGGGELQYAYMVAVDATRWTEPVSGVLTFEAMKERAGTTYRWKLQLPKGPQEQADGATAWTEAQRTKIVQRGSAWSPILLESRLTPAP